MVLNILLPNFQSLLKNGGFHTWRAVPNIHKVTEKRSAQFSSPLRSRFWGCHATAAKETKSPNDEEPSYKSRRSTRSIPTPLENGFNPAEFCMGRRLRTTLPTILSKLIPQWPELANLRETEEKIRSKQAVQYNQRHAAKELSDLLPGDRQVYVPIAERML